MPSDSGPYIECAKCGDRIRSEHRHDFRTCKCKATFVDGGYLRVGGYPRMKDGKIEEFNAATPPAPSEGLRETFPGEWSEQDRRVIDDAMGLPPRQPEAPPATTQEDET